jgi:hypothetical protein
MNHYLQNIMISPRSRAEYDEFNRFHFSQLRQQGRNKRTVTPKVRQLGLQDRRGCWCLLARFCSAAACS